MDVDAAPSVKYDAGNNADSRDPGLAAVGQFVDPLSPLHRSSGIATTSEGWTAVCKENVEINARRIFQFVEAASPGHALVAVLHYTDMFTVQMYRTHSQQHGQKVL